MHGRNVFFVFYVKSFDKTILSFSMTYIGGVTRQLSVYMYPQVGHAQVIIKFPVFSLCSHFPLYFFHYNFFFNL